LSVGKRIKELRKDHLHLNQTDFGAPLGLTYSAIGGYEKEIRGVSDATILSICREYGVREEWLRDGTGDVFASGQVPSTIVSNLAQEYDLDLMDQNLIAEYLKLDKQSREVLKGYIRRVFLASDEEAAIREEVASYEAELRAEKGEKSSASGTTNAKEA
jgi:transcriptional regulator with XRE-family HTH domain